MSALNKRDVQLGSDAELHETELPGRRDDELGGHLPTPEGAIETIQVSKHCERYDGSCHTVWTIWWRQPNSRGLTGNNSWAKLGSQESGMEFYGPGRVSRFVRKIEPCLRHFDPLVDNSPWKFFHPLIVTVPIYDDENKHTMAWVYVRREGDGKEGAFVGIPALWKDRARGNYAEDDEPWITFSGRYWAAEGPGVFPLPIEDETKPLREVYGNQLNDVLDAWKETR